MPDPTPSPTCHCGLCLSPTEAAAEAAKALSRGETEPGTLRLAQQIGDNKLADHVRAKKPPEDNPFYRPLWKIGNAVVDHHADPSSLCSEKINRVVNAATMAVHALADTAEGAKHEALRLTATANRHKVPGLLKVANGYRQQAACCIYCIANLDSWLMWIDAVADMSGGRILSSTRGITMGEAAEAFTMNISAGEHAKAVCADAASRMGFDEKLPTFSGTDDADQT